MNANKPRPPRAPKAMKAPTGADALAAGSSANASSATGFRSSRAKNLPNPQGKKRKPEKSAEAAALKSRVAKAKTDRANTAKAGGKPNAVRPSGKSRRLSAPTKSNSKLGATESTGIPKLGNKLRATKSSGRPSTIKSPSTVKPAHKPGAANLVSKPNSTKTGNKSTTTKAQLKSKLAKSRETKDKPGIDSRSSKPKGAQSSTLKRSFQLKNREFARRSTTSAEPSATVAAPGKEPATSSNRKWVRPKIDQNSRISKPGSERKKIRLPARFSAQRGVEILSGSSDPIIDLQERLREKREAQLAAVFYRLFFGVLTVGFFVLVIWLLWFSPIFALESEQVTITGEIDGFDTSAIMEEIVEQQGTPLLRVDLDKIEQAAEADPNVESAKAALDWPNGITLEVTRRIPAFAILTDDAYEYVATDGVTVSQGNSTAGELILLSVTDTTDQDQYADSIALASEVYATLSEQLLEQVESLQVSPRSATFYLVSGAQVIWGNSENADLKLQVLEILLSERSATTYDVSDPSRPVTVE